jgi:hypothetical protein
VTMTRARRVSTREMAQTYGKEVMRLREELHYSWPKICEATGLKLCSVQSVYYHATQARAAKQRSNGDEIEARHRRVRDFIQFTKHPGFTVVEIKEYVETIYKKNPLGLYVLAGLEQTYWIESFNMLDSKVLHCTVAELEDHTLRECRGCEESIIFGR